jgi:hypothetical protein
VLCESAIAAADMPPDRKQSSHSQSSETPASSALRATEANRSGANCGRNTQPTRAGPFALVAPCSMGICEDLPSCVVFAVPL